MAEYTCSVCGEKFNEEEKNLTNDEQKCILHCDKEDNFVSDFQIKFFIKNIHNKLKDKIDYTFESVIFSDLKMSCITNGKVKLRFKNCKFYGIVNKLESVQSFTKCIFFKDIHLSLRMNNLSTLFTNCEFNSNIELGNSNLNCQVFDNCKFSSTSTLEIYNSKFFNTFFVNNNLLPSRIMLQESTFSKNFNIRHKKNEISMSIQDCYFDEEFSVWGCENVKKICMHRCKFNGSLNIVNNSINDLNISQFLIEEDASFENNKINKVFCRNITFHNFASFRNSYFDSDLDLITIHFKKKVSFSDSVVKGKLNLRDTIFNDEVNFIGISKTNAKLITVNVKNRETARKIKDSFERQNNIIEANKYYAVEMKEREKELNIIKNPFDWLVFKVHRWSSNHSQNWLLPLVWIFIISYLVTSIKTTYGIFETILYNIFIFGVFDKMANVINPFSIMTRGEILTFNMLFLKVIIAYLIYQFIVSIRQNTRRK